MAIGATDTGIFMPEVPTGPLERRSAASHVAAWIRARILAGDLQPGDRVTQEDVARALDVSRIPVREALVALDLEGWVTARPHRGAFVTGVDERWVRDHYELLGMLFGLAAGWAAERGTATDRTVLADLHADHDAATGVDRFDAANHALLEHVLVMARSPRVVASLRASGSIIPGNFFAAVPDTIAPQRVGVAATVAAIDRGDRTTAHSTLAELVARQGDAVVALLADRGVLVAEVA